MIRWVLRRGVLDLGADAGLRGQSSNELVSTTPQASQSELTRAVDAAEQAFTGGWGTSGILQRQGIMLKWVLSLWVEGRG